MGCSNKSQNMMQRIEDRFETRAKSFLRSFGRRFDCSPSKQFRKSGLQKEDYPMRALFTKWDCVKDTLQTCLAERNCQVPFLADEILKFVPLYSWEDCSKNREVNIALLHHDTIAANVHTSFGAVLGERLDPCLDHIVSVALVEGVEFGMGVCNKKNIKMAAKRDFMCEKGGWGYYNYKVKYKGMKPKYPPGWYAETHDCVMRQPEEEILKEGDVLTMVISREGVGADGRGKGTGKFSIRYYKNGEDMNFAFFGLTGPLSLCCNFYFMKSAIRILSDHKLKRLGTTRRRY